MKREEHSIYKWMMIFCIIISCIVFGRPGIVHAQDTEKEQVVKVGYLLLPGYQEGGDGEYKTGQGYEYLQTIAGYTGWTYEYVYGDFSELLQKLRDGEIDIMGNLTITDDRKQQIAFGTYEQGKEAFYLFVNGTDSGITNSDFSSLNGKKIGVSSDSYQKILWQDWCKENKVQCEVIEFGSIEERIEALNSHEIDGMIEDYLFAKREQVMDCRSVLKIGDAPYYFGVNKDKPELLKQLNMAQGKILSENPYYNEELSTRYMQNDNIGVVQLGEDEINWLKEKGGQIRVGCLDDYLPISDKDENGNMKGVIPELLAEIEEEYQEYDVHFEPMIFNDYREMVKALQDGTIDLAAPIYGDYWNADKEKICLTNSFMSTTMLLINKGKYSPDTIRKIGVDRQSPLQTVYAEIYYQDSYECVMYPSMTEVAKAVDKGEVDVALCTACSYHVAAKQDDILKNMNRATLPQQVNIVMAVAKQNSELMSFMNRGIASVGETKIFNSLAVNSNVDQKTTLIDYVSQNPASAMGICGVVILVLVVIIVRLKRTMQKVKTDPMTGLLNKTAMQEQIKEQMVKGGALFMIDIDNFKCINDVLGHKAGDLVIQQFSEALKKIFRSKDIIGRFGGDEFMVFLPGAACDEEVIHKKVDMMEKTLAQSEVLEGTEQIKGSVSVGVLIIEPKEEISYPEAFEKVDAALYKAKERGRNTYVITK